jgi:hypothetical protein
MQWHVCSASDSHGVHCTRQFRFTLSLGVSTDWDTLDDTEIDKHPYGFLLSFEPLLDKYAVLLARGTKRYHGSQHDMAVPLGHHHQRGVVLPLAVSEKGGAVNFTVHRRAGCSSLLAANTTATATWGSLCRPVLERRRLESISMAHAMSLAGPLPIRHLKIDAQGTLTMLRHTYSPTDRCLTMLLCACPQAQALTSN